jgi:hypothetical protein
MFSQVPETSVIPENPFHFKINLDGVFGLLGSLPFFEFLALLYFLPFFEFLALLYFFLATDRSEVDNMITLRIQHVLI